MATRVDGPGGTWHVRRRWTPRAGPETLWGRARRRFTRTSRRARDFGDADLVPDGCGIDAAEAILVVVIAVVVVLFLALVAIPFLVALLEALVLVLLVLLSAVARVVFRRPWTIDAAGPHGAHHVWRIVGWRASSAAQAHIATALALGYVPSPEEVASAAMGR